MTSDETDLKARIERLEEGLVDLAMLVAEGNLSRFRRSLAASSYGAHLLTILAEIQDQKETR